SLFLFSVMLSLLLLFFFSSSLIASPLGDYEKELNKEGLDVEGIHKLLKEESSEVEAEFGTSEMQSELKKLRSAYAAACPANLTLRPVKTELEINGELAKDLFEGDIVLTPEQWKVALERDPENPMQRRQALSNSIQLWQPMGAPVIPYTFEPGFPANRMQIILESQRFWEQRTCIRFRPATSADRAVVSYNHNSAGCSSSVGMSGYKQTINLAPGCFSVTVVAHEISHAFGTLHVQSRSDRDNYIIVDTANIQRGTEHNFMKDPPYYGALSTYGIPYEIGSMQHYYEKAFSINTNRPTIYTKPQYSQYQYSMEAPRATFYDTLLINKMYKCTDKCRNRIACQNNGVQDGSDCNKCFCPKGWAGTNCERRPADAQIVNISGSKSIRVEIGDGVDRGFREKLYIIQAPAGKRIEATVTRVGDYQWSMCRSIGMEIVATQDTRVAGFRFCANSRIKPIVSDSNTMLVWVYVDNAHKFNADLSLRIG
ncbi:hypothetical protein PFISCL1PPCAC_17463, partial [Pristionchus fissidentatus]